MNEIATLSPNEKKRLEKCEQAIHRGLHTFVEVGQALTEIRDAKLYRASHKTFETYCKERWEISRPRAYELIDHAKVAASDPILSDASDKLTARDVRAIKDDAPAVAAEIKSRIKQGDAPQKAVAAVVAEKREERQARSKKPVDEEWEKQRQAAADALPQSVKDHQAAKAAAIAGRKEKPVNIEALIAENQELREANAALETEVEALKADNKKYEAMRVQFEMGGFDKVIEGKDAEIAALLTRVERESQEKVKNLRSADYWKRKAVEHGYSRDVTIDLETGEVVNG